MKMTAQIIASLSLVCFLNVNAYAITDVELEKQLLEKSMQDAAVESAATKPPKEKEAPPKKEIQKQEKADPKQQKPAKAESIPQPKVTKDQKTGTKPLKANEEPQKVGTKQQQSTKSGSAPPPKSSKNQIKVESFTAGKVKIHVGMTQDDFLKVVLKKDIVSQLDKPDPANPKNHFIEKDCKVDGKEFSVIIARKPDTGPYRIISILTKK